MTENLLALGATSLGIGTFVALALMFILLAPRERTHQILAIGALALALNYVLLQISIDAHNNNGAPQQLLNLERAMAALFLIESVARLLGIIQFLRLQEIRAYRWLTIIVMTVAAIIIISISPIFDRFGVSSIPQIHQPQSLYPLDYLKYVTSGIPFVVLTSGAGLLAVLSVNLLNTYLFIRHRVSNQAILGSICYLISLLATTIPEFVWLIPWAMMAGGLLIAHAILTGTLFNPLRITNEGLKLSVGRARKLANRLERTIEAAELEVRDRTRELSVALEREQNLAKELEYSLEVESELNQLKSKIITNVSHEFRTPLTIIRSSSELLTEYYDKLNEEKRKKYRSQITAQIAYLDELLVDVLFINDTDPQGIVPEWEWFTLDTFSSQLTHAWQHTYSHKGKLQFSFLGPEDLPFQSDIRIIQNIGTNLLSNAIKYAAPNPVISIIIRLNNDFLNISFKDNGMGVPAGEHEKIFELFYRGTNIDNQRGMGLGLFSARKMAQALAGEISVEQTSENGTTFTIKIPVRAPEPNESSKTLEGNVA